MKKLAIWAGIISFMALAVFLAADALLGDFTWVALAVLSAITLVTFAGWTRCQNIDDALNVGLAAAVAAITFVLVACAYIFQDISAAGTLVGVLIIASLIGLAAYVLPKTANEPSGRQVIIILSIESMIIVAPMLVKIFLF